MIMDVSVFLYFSIIALTLFLMQVIPLRNHRERKSLLGNIKMVLSIFLISYPLIVLLGSRINIGTDYANYERLYDYYLDTGITTFEPFFYSLFWLGDKYQWNFDTFIIITSILCVIVPLGFIKIKFSKEDLFVATFTLLVLLFGAWFNIIRQSIAMGVLLISIHYLIKGKVIPYVLIVLIASLCHISSLLFLPILLVIRTIQKSETPHKLIRNLFFLVLACFVLIYSFLKFGANLAYFDHVGGKEDDGITSKWFIIFSLFLYLPEFFNIKNILKYNKMYSVLYMLVALEFCCYLFGLYMNLGYRIGQLFSLVHVFLLPTTIKCTKISNKTITKLYVVSVLLTFFYFTTFVAKYNGMYSYKYSTSVFYELVPF